MRAMRAISVCAVFLTLASPYLDLALSEPTRPSYTTLVVEFAGERNRFIPPVVVSASSEEGEWYKQHLSPEFPVYVQVVPASVLNEITHLPLLESAH